MVETELLDEFSGKPIHHPFAVLYFSPIEQKDCWIACSELKQVARLIYRFKTKEIPYRVLRVRTGDYLSQNELLHLLEKYQRYSNNLKAPQKVSFFQADSIGEMEV